MNTKRILPPTYFICSIILIAIFHFIVPVKVFIHFPWNLAGLPFLAISGIMNLSADRDFKQFETTVKPFEISNKLITTGVFHFTRNPMYLGMTFFLIGEAILFGSISPYFIVIAFFILIDRIFIQTEEKMLLTKFPNEYKKYMQKVRRWV